MKYFKIFVILLCCSFMSFYACNDKTSSTKKEEPKPVQSTSVDTTTTSQNTGTTSQNTGTVWHYTCAKGHAGGSAAGNCSTCGAALAHNQAFHSNTNNTSTDTPPPLFGNPTKESSTNTAGVSHYICAKGHAGGSAAGNCSTCGEALVHNQAYHQ